MLNGSNKKVGFKDGDIGQAERVRCGSEVIVASPARHCHRRRNKVRKRLENYRRGAKKKRAIIGREGKKGKSGMARWTAEGAKALIS